MREEPRFHEVEFVHRGELTEVHRLRDLALHRDVAAKCVRVDLDGPLREEADQLLRREATARAQLPLSGILPLLDVVVLDGVVCLLGPWLPGSLTRDEPSREPAQLVDIVGRVAATLDALHDHGWWHGDIAPGNVLVDPCGQPVLGDLGTLTPLGERRVGTGGVMLTPPLAAPEVWRNDPVDRRSDVYSLAALTFWLMTGRMPFEADHPDDVRDLHLSGPRPRVSDVTGGFGPSTDAVVQRGLARDIDQRPARCGELASQLRRSIEADGVQGTGRAATGDAHGR